MRTLRKKMRMKKILDACCGGRMFWFDKKNSDVLFVDSRKMEKQLIWKSKTDSEEAWFEVSPDQIMDFRALQLPDEAFSLVVFDPPHIVENGKVEGWMRKKYGALDPKTWREDLRKGFSECLRVLKKDGVLIFKWNEVDKPVSEILKLVSIPPLFGHKSGKQQKTHWLVFMKL
jgi:SAM-dependent methyltransferase